MQMSSAEILQDYQFVILVSAIGYGSMIRKDIPIDSHTDIRKGIAPASILATMG